MRLGEHEDNMGTYVDYVFAMLELVKRGPALLKVLFKSLGVLLLQLIDSRWER